MGFLRGLLAAVKALSWLKWLSPLGFVAKWANPVWGVTLTALQAVWGAVMYVLKGIFSFLQNPAETIAVIVIAIIAGAAGVHFGIGWDNHLVQKARTQLANVQKAMGVVDEEDARRAAAAVKERRDAEAAERARIAQEAARDPPSPPLGTVTILPVTPAVTDPALKSNGVRAIPAASGKVRRSKQKSCVFGLPADWC